MAFLSEPNMQCPCHANFFDFIKQKSWRKYLKLDMIVATQPSKIESYFWLKVYLLKKSYLAFLYK